MFNRNQDAQYRKEGLSMMQASKLADHQPESSAKLLIAGLAVVAVGCLAFLGIQQVSRSDETRLLYTAAPPSGTAQQIMMALKAPHDREAEAARMALLENNPGMEMQSLETVEQLINPTAQRAPTPAAAPAPQVVAAAAPEPAIVIEAEVPPAPLETAALEIAPLDVAEPEIVALEIEAPETEAVETAELEAVAPTAPSEQITDIETLRAVVSPELLEQTVLVSPCFDELQDAALDSTIYFSIGSAQLSVESIDRISRIGQLAAECETAKIHVTGHSDTTGNDLTNLNLSWQRADNTVAALEQMGIDTSRFEPVGFGARTPLAQGDASDEDRNRRVEFVILKNTERN